MIKVSIIVPVYNVEKYVGRCLESIVKQTYPNIEVICVDDCGTDSSIKIVEGYKRKYPSIISVIKHECNQGLGAARDTGLEAATGEYVLFVDSDDYIKSNYVETYMQEVERNFYDVIIGGYIRDNDGRMKKYSVNKDLMSPWTYVSACIKLYRKSFLEQYGINFQGIKRYEDGFFSYKILLNNAKVKIIDYAGYYYFCNNASITRNKEKSRKQLFYEYSDLCISFYKEINKQQMYNDKMEILEYCLMSNVIANAFFNCHGCGLKEMKKVYDKFQEVLQCFPQGGMKNKYISLKYLKSENIKQRYATWLVMRMRKLGLEQTIFWILSRL